MFVDKLSRAEQNVLMDLFMHVSCADGKLARRELNYIQKVLTRDIEMKIGLAERESIESLCSRISTDESKIIILQEVIRLALIDDDFCQTEKSIINEITKCFFIDRNKYDEVVEWVKKGIDWLKTGKGIIATLKSM